MITRAHIACTLQEKKFSVNATQQKNADEIIKARKLMLITSIPFLIRNKLYIVFSMLSAFEAEWNFEMKIDFVESEIPTFIIDISKKRTLCLCSTDKSLKVTFGNETANWKWSRKTIINKN